MVTRSLPLSSGWRLSAAATRLGDASKTSPSAWKFYMWRWIFFAAFCFAGLREGVRLFIACLSPMDWMRFRASFETRPSGAPQDEEVS